MTPAAGSPALFSRIFSRLSYMGGCTLGGVDAEPVSRTINKMFLLQIPHAFQTLGGVAVSGTFKLLFPLPALATWHKGLALESARKLLTYQPSLLAVGHGRVLSLPQSAMKRAINVMEQSLAKEERKRTHVA